MAKFSTGLRNGMLMGAGLKTALDGGRLCIFTGPAPESADDETTGELLIMLTAGGDGDIGLTFGDAEGGVLSKSDAEVWMDSAVRATGKCGYFRFTQMADDNLASTIAPRIQGTCGIVNADMVLTNLDVTQGLPWTLNYFNVALPTQ